MGIRDEAEQAAVEGLGRLLGTRPGMAELDVVEPGAGGELHAVPVHWGLGDLAVGPATARLPSAMGSLIKKRRKRMRKKKHKKMFKATRWQRRAGKQPSGDRSAVPPRPARCQPTGRPVGPAHPRPGSTGAASPVRRSGLDEPGEPLRQERVEAVGSPAGPASGQPGLHGQGGLRQALGPGARVHARPQGVVGPVNPAGVDPERGSTTRNPAPLEGQRSDHVAAAPDRARPPTRQNGTSAPEAGRGPRSVTRPSAARRPRRVEPPPRPPPAGCA